MLKAPRGFDSVRLTVAHTGLERAGFAAESSPLPPLAALLARRYKPAEAWTYLEANLARGLLDDLAAQKARPLSAAEARREQELFDEVQRLDGQLAAIRAAKQLGTDERRKKEDELSKQRDALLAEYTQFEQELARKYGLSAGKAYDLAQVQGQLPADAALVAWVDQKGHPTRPTPAASTGPAWCGRAARPPGSSCPAAALSIPGPRTMTTWPAGSGKPSSFGPAMPPRRGASRRPGCTGSAWSPWPSAWAPPVSCRRCGI